jgi:hypothetical protein
VEPSDENTHEIQYKRSMRMELRGYRYLFEPLQQNKEVAVDFKL